MDNTKTKKNRGEAFVDFVLNRMKNDSRFGAVLRRADNPATEYQSWEYLADQCDIDKEWEWRPFAVIAASVARAKPQVDGSLGIGKAIAECYEDRNRSDPAKAKLRRLLACTSAIEACTILRPLLRLISSRNIPLCYGKLLDELIYFGNGERIKVKWAIDFYGRRNNDSLGS